MNWRQRNSMTVGPNVVIKVGPNQVDKRNHTRSDGDDATGITVVMPHRSSKAVILTYTLFAEYDRLLSRNREFWRARVVDYRGVRLNFPRAGGWASQAEAEQHAESIARYSAKRKGILLPDEKPRWRLI
jgi:hypothetical protein